MSAAPGRSQAKHLRPVPEIDLAWQSGARCTGLNPELFFPTKSRSGPTRGRSAIPAQRICQRCDVQLQCLQYAITHSDGRNGIWGGATEDELSRMRREHRKGRVRQ